jgi:hypothetical protein
MSNLPDMLRRTPFVFYGLAAVFFVWSLANAWLLISQMGQYADPTMEGAFTAQKSAALFQAALEASYLVANGAMLQILIAIFDNLKGPEA